MVRTFCYIPYSLVDRALSLGWLVTNALDGTGHGAYACLGEWLCECPVPEIKE